jgi:hypothetical protein
MACLATDSFPHMNAMIEVDEIRKVMNADPLERFLCLIARTHRLKHRARVPDLRVTRHTCVGRWNPRKRRRFGRGMAVCALYSQTVDMMFMAERNRLLTGHMDIGEVSGTIDFYPHSPNHKEQDQSSNDARSGNDLHAWMKYLSHRGTNECILDYDKYAESTARSESGGIESEVGTFRSYPDGPKG